MRPLLIAAALVLAAAPVAAPAKFKPAAQRPAGTVIRDPKAFVLQAYGRIIKGGDYRPADDIYTPRLDALWKSMDDDARGEVPRVNFLFWINGQDGMINSVVVSDGDVEQRPQGDRKVVVATFTNENRPQQINFYFERTAAGWKLDDAESVKDEVWTLSVLLKYGGWSAPPILPAPR